MEYEKLKIEIKDIIEIVKSCPENLQEKCFEILLSNLINPTDSKSTKPNSKKEKEVEIPNEAQEQTDNGTQEKSDDAEIESKDLHIKTRKLLDTKGIKMDLINKLYYKDNGKILPLYEDLATNKASETQVRISLLTAFENSFENGDFTFSKTAIKDKCKLLKCYDGNFSNNFKNNKDLFDDIEDEQIRLSTKGKDELANILQGLASK